MAALDDWLAQLFGPGSQQQQMPAPTVPPASMPAPAAAPSPQAQPMPAQAQAPAAPTDSLSALAQYKATLNQQPSDWKKALGLFGGALQDFSAVRSGHPELANFMSDYGTSLRQRQLSQLGQNAQSDVLNSVSGADPTKPVPTDVLLKLAKLNALGVDTSSVQNYLSARAPKYEYQKDGEGNLLRTDQYGNETPLGANKPIVVGPGQTVFQPDALGGSQPQGPAGSSTSPQAPALPSGDQVAAAIAQQYPGARVTSGLRTPGQNAAANGVSNSAHLQDTPTTWARDIVLPNGTDHQAAANQINALGIPGIKALYEGPGAANSTGPHLHVQYIAPNGSAPTTPAPPASGQQANGGRVLFQSAPEWRPLSAAEQKQYPEGIQINGGTGEVKYPPQGAMPSQLSPEAIKQGAASFIQNGGKYPIGMRDKTSVAAIQNFVASIKPQGMADNDWARVIQNNGLSLKARSTAAGKAGGMQVATAINEGTVNNSINILRGLIPLAASTGPITSLNNFTQAVSRQTNDADAANFKNAIDSISAEYARVMTGSTTGAPSSDSARKEAGERILTGYNNKVLPQVLNQMQQEMRGRSASYSDVLNQLTGGNYGGAQVPFSPPAAPQQKPPQSGVVRVNSPVDAAKLPKGTKFLTPDGRVLVRQ